MDETKKDFKSKVKVGRLLTIASYIVLAIAAMAFFLTAKGDFLTTYPYMRIVVCCSILIILIKEIRKLIKSN